MSSQLPDITDPVRPTDSAAPAAPMTAPTMAALVAEIVATHHALLRREVPRIEQITHDLTSYEGGGGGGADDAVLMEIRQLASGLAACVAQQLDREEQVLFPMLVKLEQQTEVTKCHAGMIRSRLMMAERDAARVRGVLSRLRELATENLSPAGPCEACHALLAVIDEVLADLQEHTTKECDRLFPWAVRREAELAR